MYKIDFTNDNEINRIGMSSIKMESFQINDLNIIRIFYKTYYVVYCFNGTNFVFKFFSESPFSLKCRYDNRYLYLPIECKQRYAHNCFKWLRYDTKTNRHLIFELNSNTMKFRTFKNSTDKF